MRVFITGIGIVSPLAAGARATMDRLVRGERAMGPVTLFDVSQERANERHNHHNLRADREAEVLESPKSRFPRSRPSLWITFPS